MISKDRSWGRWAGYRSDLVSAAELAANTIQTWSGGAEPNVTVMVTHADRLTEHTNTLDTVTKLHRDELRGVRVVWIEVEAMPPKLRGVVRIRLTRGDGLTLRVWATIEPASRGSLSALARSSAEPPRVCTV